MFKSMAFEKTMLLFVFKVYVSTNAQQKKKIESSKSNIQERN